MPFWHSQLTSGVSELLPLWQNQRENQAVGSSRFRLQRPLADFGAFGLVPCVWLLDIRYSRVVQNSRICFDLASIDRCVPGAYRSDQRRLEVSRLSRLASGAPARETALPTDTCGVEPSQLF